MKALFVLATATAAALTVLPTQISRAEPRPTLEQVQQRIDALNSQIEIVDEEYVGSRLQLGAAKRRAAVAQARVRAARAELNTVQASMSAVAAAVYRSGGTDQFVQLITTSNPQTFLDRAASLDRIAAGQSAKLAAAATARHRLESVQADATAGQAQQATVAKQMATHRQVIENALNEQQRLLSSLQASDRRRLAALRASRLRAAAAEASRASRSRSSSDSGPAYNGPASGRASIAVKEAYAQLGKPYQWAAAGPDRFDCSGLTLWVWGKAGVSLPHQSRAQYAGGRKISQSDLQPGDLTFHGSPIHHVGIYIGHGQMISAPQTGDVVKFQNALRSDYVGAVRP